jgi:hypothetical protein
MLYGVSVHENLSKVGRFFGIKHEEEVRGKRSEAKE